jgi:hypothetical protein
MDAAGNFSWEFASRNLRSLAHFCALLKAKTAPFCSFPADSTRMRTPWPANNASRLNKLDGPQVPMVSNLSQKRAILIIG